MLHFPRWKTLSIIATLLVSLILIVPNFLSKEQQDVLKGYGLRPVTLGLDLQGGSNVLLEVDQKDLRDKLSQQLVGDIRSTLREAKIGYSGISRNDNGVSVRITKPEDLERARTQLATLQQPLETGMLGSGVQANLLDLAQNDQQFSLTFSQAG
ncbi:MAG: protein translocase subunit SecD, partial [Aestuariivirga sp.]